MCVSVLAACRAEAAVDVTVRADGSGKVTVAVGLDDEAVERVGDLDKELHSEDLVAAGWVVSKPVKRGELTWVAASKPFHSPTDLQRVVGEVGVFEGFGPVLSAK